MREIEGVEEALRKLKPHFPQLEAHFNAENERLKTLLSIDHDPIGRVLKCHLVVEHFLTRYLAERFETQTLDQAKLSFFQKAQLIPTEREIATFVRPGILSLNKARNKFTHRLDATIEFDDISSIMETLSYARHGTTFSDPYSAIEAFAAVACAFLIVTPPELQYAMAEAFQSIRVAP